MRTLRLPEIGPVTQITVLNWPVSRSARVEVCDLVRRLCGDIGVVCTVAGMMPVEELAPGVPVTLAMFAERLDHPDRVTTIVVNESRKAMFGDAQVTVVGVHGRLVLGQRGLTVSDVSGVRELRLDPSPDPVTFAIAALRKEFSVARHGAAGLGDALAAARLVELAAQSYEQHTWIDVF